MRAPLKIRVGWADTDAQRGHVHHASFYRWLDDARVACLRKLDALALENELVTRVMELSYLSPIDYDDEVAVDVTLQIGVPRPVTSITFAYEIYKQGRHYIPSAQGRQVMVRVSPDGIPLEIDPRIRTRLEEALDG